MGYRGAHSARQRLIVRMGGQRVEPYQPVGGATQAGHLQIKLTGVAAIPAVRQDHHYRPASQTATVHAVELGQGSSDASPAGEVGDRGGGPVKRAVVIATRELVGDPGQARAEGK